MTLQLGVNCSPDGADSPAAIVAAGASWVRLVAKPNQDSRAIAKRYRDAGLKVLWACDADTAAPFLNQRVAAQSYRLRIGDQVDAIQCPFNEFDVGGATSSTRSEVATFEAVQAWSETFRPLGIPIVGPGMASGQPDRWSARCNQEVDAIALHLYSPSPAEMLGTAGAFRARWQKPIWVTEWPLWSEAHARAAVQASDGPAFIYCWHSWKNAAASWEDGLLDLNGQPTWRLAEFTKLAKELNVATDQDVLDRLKASEERNALTIDLVARTLKGKWKGGADSAEALIRTISPDKYGDHAPGGPFTAVDFPK